MRLRKQTPVMGVLLACAILLTACKEATVQPDEQINKQQEFSEQEDAVSKLQKSEETQQKENPEEKDEQMTKEEMNQNTEQMTQMPEVAVSERTYLPTKDYVRALGRTQIVEDTLWMALSGAGAEFSFTGTKASITFRADSTCAASEDTQARVAVFVNGERVADEMINVPEKTVSVLDCDTAKTCVVRVVKLSEAPHSTVGISKINVTSTEDIMPTSEKSVLIEFVGDSITCGYGVDDEDENHHFSTKTEDVTKTYAYKTAENLDVDYSMISFSGYGIVSGYSGDGEKVPVQTVPQYYDKLGFSYGTYLGTYQPQKMTWDFSVRQPDLIVVNLGTNDNSYVKGDAERTEEYIAGYVDFLKTVREKNPDAKLLCVLGIMGAELYPAIEAVVERYQAETGDTKITSMQFAQQSYSDGLAADYHPTEATHIKAAAKLTAKVKELLGEQIQ